MKYIFDAHGHIQFPIYDADRDAVIERARKAGVKMIAAGSQISNSLAAIELAHKYPEDIWATVGFHPSHAAHAQTYADDNNRGLTRTMGWHHDKNEQKENVPEKFDIEKIRKLAIDPKVVGIGECGLDYYHLATSDERLATSIKEAQKEVFKKMIDLAAELKKPLVIHCRPTKDSDDAYLDLLEILENRSDIKFKVLHCFSGGLEIAKKMAEAGFYFTLGGAVTFPSPPKADPPLAEKTHIKKCAYDDVINYLPIDRIMTETDCPYIAPVSYRGSRNEPAYVTEVVKKIAEIKGISVENTVEAVYLNVSRIFGIG